MIRAVLRLQYVLPLVLLLACAGCARLGAGGKSHEQDVAEGRELYQENGCATCHGPEGHGDGPVIKTLAITPRDFRDASAFVNGYSVEQISNTIYLGLVVEDQSMPAYNHLTEDERRQLAIYIMSLGGNSKNTSKKEDK